MPLTNYNCITKDYRPKHKETPTEVKGKKVGAWFHPDNITVDFNLVLPGYFPDGDSHELSHLVASKKCCVVIDVEVVLTPSVDNPNGSIATLLIAALIDPQIDSYFIYREEIIPGTRRSWRLAREYTRQAYVTS